jgi:hypothetical protein
VYSAPPVAAALLAARAATARGAPLVVNTTHPGWPAYAARAQAVAREQLAVAGVRLAAALNVLLVADADADAPPPPTGCAPLPPPLPPPPSGAVAAAVLGWLAAAAAAAVAVHWARQAAALRVVGAADAELLPVLDVSGA